MNSIRVVLIIFFLISSACFAQEAKDSSASLQKPPSTDTGPKAEESAPYQLEKPLIPGVKGVHGVEGSVVPPGIPPIAPRLNNLDDSNTTDQDKNK